MQMHWNIFRENQRKWYHFSFYLESAKTAKEENSIVFFKGARKREKHIFD